MRTRSLLAVAGLLVCTQSGWPAAKPTTVAELALYQGRDREKVLIDGARKEAQVLFYNSNTWLSNVAEEFEKKYPFIKVSPPSRRASSTAS
ncbi:MAG TPA: hypothetical protein VGA09_03770, partial [Candidatus Binatia bacterium]